MFFGIGPGFYIFAALLLLPWLIVVGIAILARPHFRKFMPFYIGGAFAFEILIFFLLFGFV